MKRVLPIFLSVILMIGIFPLSCFAQESKNVTYFSDGSYMVETLTVYATRASGSVTGNKVSTWYTSSGGVQWAATLTGSFTYTGSSATCTSASVSTSISNSKWYTSSKSASKSGNTASATVTMGRKALGVTVETRTVNMALTCDANGNLS